MTVLTVNVEVKILLGTSSYIFCNADISASICYLGIQNLRQKKTKKKRIKYGFGTNIQTTHCQRSKWRGLSPALCFHSFIQFHSSMESSSEYIIFTIFSKKSIILKSKWFQLISQMVGSEELHGSEKQQVRDRNKVQKLLMFVAPCRKKRVLPTQQNQTIFFCQNPVFSTLKKVTLPVTSFHWTEMCVCHPQPGAGHPSARWSLGKGSHWECSPWLPPCSPAPSPPQAGPHQPHWWMGELQGPKVRRTLTQHLSGGCDIRLGLQEGRKKPPVNPVKDEATPWVVQLEQLSITPRTAAELQDRKSVV